MQHVKAQSETFVCVRRVKEENLAHFPTKQLSAEALGVTFPVEKCANIGNVADRVPEEIL